jgi:transposase
VNFRTSLAAQSAKRRVHTPEQIAALKADLEAGMPEREAARKHGLSRWIVRDVIDRRSWRGIEPKEVE